MILGDLYNTLFVGLYWKPPEQPYLTMAEERYTLRQLNFVYNKQTQSLSLNSILFSDETQIHQLLFWFRQANYYNVSRMYNNPKTHMYDSHNTMYTEWTFVYRPILSDALGNKFLTKEEKDINSRRDQGVYYFKSKSGVEIQWNVI